jgi:AcrR family transcriptional regulator
VSKAQTLEPRRRPTAGPARKTFERILSSTAELLDEVGFDDLNTNLIAEHANVNVASVYKYFPNKYAVLTALAEAMREEQLELLSERLEPHGDWRGELGALLESYVELFVSRPGFAALAAVLSSSPSLREIDEASLAAEAHVIAEQLVGYGIDEKKADREAIARVILEAARGVLPLIRLAGPAKRKRLTRELRRMLEAYLAGYIDN